MSLEAKYSLTTEPITKFAVKGRFNDWQPWPIAEQFYLFAEMALENLKGTLSPEQLTKQLEQNFPGYSHLITAALYNLPAVNTPALGDLGRIKDDQVLKEVTFMPSSWEMDPKIEEVVPDVRSRLKSGRVAISPGAFVVAPFEVKKWGTSPKNPELAAEAFMAIYLSVGLLQHNKKPDSVYFGWHANTITEINWSDQSLDILNKRRGRLSRSMKNAQNLSKRYIARPFSAGLNRPR